MREELRARFTPVDLGMLFGAASSHVQHRTRFNYVYVRDDYQQFLRDYITSAAREEDAAKSVR